MKYRFARHLRQGVDGQGFADTNTEIVKDSTVVLESQTTHRQIWTSTMLKIRRWMFTSSSLSAVVVPVVAGGRDDED